MFSLRISYQGSGETSLFERNVTIAENGPQDSDNVRYTEDMSNTIASCYWLCDERCDAYGTLTMICWYSYHAAPYNRMYDANRENESLAMILVRTVVGIRNVTNVQIIATMSRSYVKRGRN